MNALFPGSFHPPTNGHMDVIARISALFDTVYVAVMANPEKRYAISAEERTEMLKKCVKEYTNVQIVTGSGLTAELASKLGCGVIVKGVRDADDFYYEMRQADVNRRISGVETLLIPSDPKWGSIASSIVMDIAHHGGDIQAFVPPEIYEDILSAIRKGV
ncbi:MAG: pantetheine-phosphate adenylyltransferase [Clostridia bacterium]|nr:pantetheine-phosphate adenylyltransferase [Clostridia bacterium]